MKPNISQITLTLDSEADNAAGTTEHEKAFTLVCTVQCAPKEIREIAMYTRERDGRVSLPLTLPQLDWAGAALACR